MPRRDQLGASSPPGPTGRAVDGAGLAAGREARRFQARPRLGGCGRLGHQPELGQNLHLIEVQVHCRDLFALYP